MLLLQTTKYLILSLGWTNPFTFVILTFLSFIWVDVTLGIIPKLKIAN
jgi:hypothetical protein